MFLLLNPLLNFSPSTALAVLFPDKFLFDSLPATFRTKSHRNYELANCFGDFLASNFAILGELNYHFPAHGILRALAVHKQFAKLCSFTRQVTTGFGTKGIPAGSARQEKPLLSTQKTAPHVGPEEEVKRTLSAVIYPRHHYLPLPEPAKDQ